MRPPTLLLSLLALIAGCKTASTRVRELCDKYGIPYSTGPLHRQYGQVLRTVMKLSLPNRMTKDDRPPTGVDITVEYPTSGSGNMIPGPMNEALQKDLSAVGINVKLKPIEWAAMLAQLATGMPKGIDAMNISLTYNPGEDTVTAEVACARDGVRGGT